MSDTSSTLQGESQVNVFHLLVEIGLVPFYKHGFLGFHVSFNFVLVRNIDNAM